MNKDFREFISLESAIRFGSKYNGEWLKEFQEQGRWHGFYELNDIECFIDKGEITQEYLEKIEQECRIYKTFSYYCGGNYGLAINEVCRKGYTNFSFNKETVRAMIEIMDNEISKFEVHENIVAYRSLTYADLLSVQKKEKVKKGDIIVDQGFMGVGLVKEQLLKEHDYDTIMKVYIPIGSQAIYLDLISRRSNEQELLLKRGTRLMVLSNKASFIKKKRNIECKVLL